MTFDDHRHAPTRYSNRISLPRGAVLLDTAIPSLAKRATIMIRLKSLVAHPMARIRLLGIPFAGAGDVGFRPWARFLQPPVEGFAVLLPVVQDAIGVAPHTDWGPLSAARYGTRVSWDPVSIVTYRLGLRT